MSKRCLTQSLCAVAVSAFVLLLISLACPSAYASASPDSLPPKAQNPVLAQGGCPGSYKSLLAFQADTVPRDYVALGSVRGYMYVLRKRGAGYLNVWNSFYLGSPIKKIVADDVDGNGVTDLIVITSAGRMFIFDTSTHLLVWENTSNDFGSVSDFLIDQLDTDKAREIIACADSRLVIMDGEKLLREYQSPDEFRAEYMVIGDVDDDDEKEIVLDSGYVINAKTLNIEWQTDFFGTKLSLLDVDADGVEELICESTGGAIKVYDLDTRQEKTVF